MSQEITNIFLAVSSVAITITFVLSYFQFRYQSKVTNAANHLKIREMFGIESLRMVHGKLRKNLVRARLFFDACERRNYRFSFLVSLWLFQNRSSSILFPLLCLQLIDASVKIKRARKERRSDNSFV